MKRITLMVVKEIADRIRCMLRCTLSVFVYAIGGRKAVQKLARSKNRLAIFLNRS